MHEGRKIWRAKSFVHLFYSTLQTCLTFHIVNVLSANELFIHMKYVLSVMDFYACFVLYDCRNLCLVTMLSVRNVDTISFIGKLKWKMTLTHWIGLNRSSAASVNNDDSNVRNGFFFISHTHGNLTSDEY